MLMMPLSFDYLFAFFRLITPPLRHFPFFRHALPARFFSFAICFRFFRCRAIDADFCQIIADACFRYAFYALAHVHQYVNFRYFVTELSLRFRY